VTLPLLAPALPRTAAERLIVPLDVPSHREALKLTERLGEDVLWVKVGLELFVSAGPAVVRDLAALGKRIFLDLKFHDIPNTVAGAVANAAELPVQLVNLHAEAGEAALAAAAQAASARPDLGVLAVTRLTSTEASPGLLEEIMELAARAHRAGLFGVVCPASAAPALRERYGDQLARVVPGIRPQGSSADDQSLVATPRSAVASGAHWIVVGRPITRAADPAAAARRIREEIEEAAGPAHRAGGQV
jgi:orotidine-5'-phosphate decarboxylase